VHPSLRTPRPAPSWLDPGPFEDRPLGALKSGKEAEVFLLERRSAAGTVLLAHKRYRPRTPRPGELRELGFSHATIYKHSATYRDGWALSPSDRRAIESGSRLGVGIAAARWPQNELAMLRRAWDAGASVPYPVERTDDGVLMEFIGDLGGAAPRLVHAGLDRAGMEEAWSQLHRELRLICSAGIVHADLSAYNLLWWRDRVVVIDFPQAADVSTHPNAADLLHRDVQNVATWFGRRGVSIDPEEVFLDLLTELYRVNR
jgi:RIO kinase 1